MSSTLLPVTLMCLVGPIVAGEALSCILSSVIVLNENASGMMGRSCDGSLHELSGGGTWKGHVYPGIVFMCWALWWAIQAFRSYHVTKARGVSYHSRGWWRDFSWTWGIEPVLKAIGPPIGVAVELWIDHDSFL